MQQETLRIMCPNLTCRKILAVPKTARGKTVRCRCCGTSIRIPNPKATSPEQQAQQPAEAPAKGKKSA